MDTDPEVGAMAKLADVLAPLEPAAQHRVLEWARARFAGSIANIDTPPPGPAAEYQEFVDLFHAADPTSAADMALVAAYWFQQVRGQPVLRAQDVNGALRDLGHGLANITDALRTLEQRKPPHIRQTGKSGRSQQARKSYKMTLEGAARVSHLIEARWSREAPNA